MATYVHMELFEVIGGQVWLNHHGVHLFSPNDPEKTTITEQANWSYDDLVDAKGDDARDGGEHPPEDGCNEAQL